MSHLAASELWQQSVQQLKEMMKLVQADALSFSTTMFACEKALQWKKVFQFLDHILNTSIRVDLVCLNHMISASSMASWHRSTYLLAAARNQRFSPDEVAFGSTLTACGSAKRWSMAEVLLIQMAQDAFALRELW
eukprot:symbB.v1.2.004660.t1/scaffold268.1/size246746/11